LDRREELKRWVLAVIELKEKLPQCEGVQLVSTCDLQTFSLLREVTQEVYANFVEYYPPGVLTGTEEGMSWLQRIFPGKKA
jgi:hypothetical protein